MSTHRRALRDGNSTASKAPTSRNIKSLQVTSTSLSASLLEGDMQGVPWFSTGNAIFAEGDGMTVAGPIVSSFTVEFVPRIVDSGARKIFGPVLRSQSWDIARSIDNRCAASLFMSLVMISMAIVTKLVDKSKRHSGEEATDHLMIRVGAACST